MKVICAICREIILPESNLILTRCGHLFHFACLELWNEKNHNCPECRRGTTKKDKFKAFLCWDDEENKEQDPSLLREDIEQLRLEILLKETELQKKINRLTELETRNEELRKTIETKDLKIKQYKSKNLTLSETISILEQNKIISQDIKIENEKLKVQIKKLENIKFLVESTETEMTEFLNSINFTFENFQMIQQSHLLLKREYEERYKKSKQMRELYENSQKELQRTKKFYDKNNESLNNKIKELKNKILYYEEKEFSTNIKEEEEKEEEENKTYLDDSVVIIEENNKIPSPISLKYKHPLVFDTPTNKTTAVNPFRKHQLKENLSTEITHPVKKLRTNEKKITIDPRNKFSIFNREGRFGQVSGLRKTSHFDEVYDGLGGHSVLDFPEKKTKK